MLNNVSKILNEFGAEVVRQSKLNIGQTKTVKGKKRKIDNSGALRNSLDYQVKVMPNSFSFFIEMEEYGEWVDVGRKPGKGIPVDKLKGWIKSKPIRLRDLKTGEFLKTTESRINSLSFLINRKIKEKGIAATNFLSDPFEKAFKDLPDDIIEAFGLDVEQFLNTSLSELNDKYK